MARLIDADALIEQIRLMANRTALGETAPSDLSGLEVCGLIFNAPTVDAVPVVHGRWIHTEIEDDDWGGAWHKWTCSNCDFSVGHNPNGTNYCPNCGAKMDLGVE